MDKFQSSSLALLVALASLGGCSSEDKEPITNAERQEIYRNLERYQRDNPSMRLSPAQNAEVAAEIELNAME